VQCFGLHPNGRTYIRKKIAKYTSNFWENDVHVSKRPEFPELRPKFERWT